MNGLLSQQTAPASGGVSITAAPSFAGALLELLPVAVYVCSADGTILLYNRRAAELWGRTPRLGDTDQRFCGAFRLFHSDGAPLPHAETPMAYALATGKGTRDREVIVERPDGSRIVVSVNIEALRDPNGAITGAVNCFQDISERKNAERRLAERERAFAELLDALPAAIYTTDAAGRLRFYNRAAVEFAGHEPKLGEDQWCISWKLLRPDGSPLPHDECPMAVSLKENRPVRDVEAIAERPDGRRIPFIPFPTPLRDESGTLTGAVNMLVDVSQAKAAEAELRASEAQARLLAQEVDHRARNLLATVQAIVRMVKADSAAEYSEVVSSRLQALARVHTLLSESRWRGADLQFLVQEELAAFRGDERVQLVGPAVALKPAAAQALSMTLHELATNALKYGGLSSAHGRLTVEWLLDGDDFVLRWSELAVSKPMQTKRGGFGLKMIKQMVALQLGGDAQFDWRSEGLCFELRVPSNQMIA